ncbi:DNA polymerase [Burkholderia sp. ABCPW 11]|uniref:relaxase/mobilization nuclease domain-containing protein n=1 Tax=Burkholderia sp. ABCPW 11 TaxID=1637859 RepID=UPI0007558D5F|nr:relaxase/mobilization nuclease domain-containing protein [Burkholderia sp. ABCPW 11]KVD47557.1 DNA polymerase [Burkholderia sp. ABCPW 11]
MPFPKAYVDSLLVNWGDRLFPEPLWHSRALYLSHGPLPCDAQRMRERLALTLRRAPEVMVRITNRASGAQGMGAVRRHLQYISRHGRVGLEDQDARVIAGDAALQDLCEEWKWGGLGLPEQSRHRETFNVMLSMPPGTSGKAVRNAARAFAREIFGDGRPYVFAQHDDEAHPHVHLCVQVRGPDGRRMNPRRQDLRHWRDEFARQLREQGVEANATPRLVRGQTQRLPKQAVVRMASRGVAPRFYQPMISERAQRSLWRAHIESLSVWRELAHALANSVEPEDRAMAMRVVEFVRRMPVRRLDPEALPRDSAVAQSRRAQLSERPRSSYAPERQRSRGGEHHEIEPPLERD